MTSPLEPLLRELRPGLEVRLPGSGSECPALVRALADEPERAAGLRITIPLIPGINRFDYAALGATTRLRTPMASPALEVARREGRLEVLPLSWGGFARLMSEEPCDLAVVHVTPPDDQGMCAFGTCADFGPLSLRNAVRTAAVVNPDLPRPAHGPRVRLSDFDVVAEVAGGVHAEAPADPRAAKPSPALEALSLRAAELIEDGAALQTGLGAAPAAVLSRLSDRRNLRIRSGLIVEAHRALAEAGALAPGPHVAGVAWGPETFLRFAAESGLFAFRSVPETHGPELAAVPKLVALNSALEVDLFGQANLEWLDGVAVSGVGGSPDFARAAAASPGGLSLIALRARARGGVSRIVPRLRSPTVSLARSEVDVVVTEYGAARLRGLSEAARARALIAVAAPDARDGLEAAWRDLSRK